MSEINWFEIDIITTTPSWHLTGAMEKQSHAQRAFHQHQDDAGTVQAKECGSAQISANLFGKRGHGKKNALSTGLSFSSCYDSKWIQFLHEPPMSTGDLVLHTSQLPGGTRRSGAYRAFLWLLFTPELDTPEQAVLATPCQQCPLPSTHLENHLEQPEGSQKGLLHCGELSTAAVPVLAWWFLLLGTAPELWHISVLADHIPG